MSYYSQATSPLSLVYERKISSKILVSTQKTILDSKNNSIDAFTDADLPLEALIESPNPL